MPTLTELIDSRRIREERGPDGNIRQEELTLHYVLDGTASESAAKTLIENSTPATYDDLVRDQIRLEPLEVDTVSGSGRWDVEVDYVLPEDQELEIGESLTSFDTTGGTQRITQSRETRQNYGPVGHQPPDFKGAIGVVGDGPDATVEGVDVVVPRFSWTETHVLPAATVTQAYIKAVEALTGMINEGVFRGREPGEVRFDGATGSKRGDDDWEITFYFAGSKNSSDERTPELINLGFGQPIVKDGWDYVWYRYRPVEVADGGTTFVIPRPSSVHVEVVYPQGDFSDLGIGT